MNRVLPIGGPGGALTAKDQADMLFRISGVKPWCGGAAALGGGDSGWVLDGQQARVAG